MKISAIIPTFNEEENIENLIKNSVNGRNKISFFLIHNNKKIKIRSSQNFNVDLNFIDKINSIDGIIDIEQFN